MEKAVELQQQRQEREDIPKIETFVRKTGNVIFSSG
jgi:hypothetical protein